MGLMIMKYAEKIRDKKLLTKTKHFKQKKDQALKNLLML